MTVRHQPGPTNNTALKCLSIRPPSAQWFFMSDAFRSHNIPPKLVENRDWTTNYRGPLLIHASRTFEQEVLDAYTSHFPQLADCIPLDEKDYVKGAILGIA